MDKILSIPISWSISLFVVVGALLYATIIERFWVEVRSVDVTMDNLPESLSGLRIVLFSDVHLGFYYQIRNLHDLVDQMNELQPAGDFRHNASQIGSSKLTQSCL